MKLDDISGNRVKVHLRLGVKIRNGHWILNDAILHITLLLLLYTYCRLYTLDLRVRREYRVQYFNRGSISGVCSVLSGARQTGDGRGGPPYRQGNDHPSLPSLNLTPERHLERRPGLTKHQAVTSTYPLPLRAFLLLPGRQARHGGGGRQLRLPGDPHPQEEGAVN